MKRPFSRIVVALAFTLMQCQSPTLGMSEGPEKETTRVLVAVAPGYPPLALGSGITGEVTVRVVVNAMGVVTSAKVTDGHRLLREGCKEAGLQWKFTPAQDEGKTERSMELKFAFFIAPSDTATAKLTTVFKHPNRIEITRRIPQSEKLQRRQHPPEVHPQGTGH